MPIKLSRHHFIKELLKIRVMFPHHTALIDKHRKKIIDSVTGVRDHDDMDHIPMPTEAPSTPPTHAAAAKEIVEDSGRCLGCRIKVAKVVVESVSLLLDLLGLGDIDPLKELNNWATKLSQPIIKYIQILATQVNEEVGAMNKAKKTAALIRAIVIAGGMSVVWQSIKQWSWWKWIQTVVSARAQITVWCASSFVFVAKLKNVVMDAFILFEDIQAMIKSCRTPKKDPWEDNAIQGTGDYYACDSPGLPALGHSPCPNSVIKDDLSGYVGSMQNVETPGKCTEIPFTLDCCSTQVRMATTRDCCPRSPTILISPAN